jgi:hypothetical protein
MSSTIVRISFSTALGAALLAAVAAGPATRAQARNVSNSAQCEPMSRQLARDKKTGKGNDRKASILKGICINYFAQRDIYNDARGSGTMTREIEKEYIKAYQAYVSAFSNR